MLRSSTFCAVLSVFAVASSGLRGQQTAAPAPAPAAPSKQAVEVTEEKKVALSADMAEFAAVDSLLKELGKATLKRKGETSPEYVARVNKIFKAQAYLISLAGRRVEAALDAKYQLEAQVDDYALWVKHLPDRLQERTREYQAEVESLGKEVQEAQYDGQVLAYLITTQGGFDETIQKRYAEEYDAATIQSVPGFRARQEKYQKIPKDKWQEEFQKLVRQVEFKSTKQMFLKKDAIPGSVALDGVLPAEHRKVLQEATEVLQKYSQLERTADQIAIYAQYVDSNLDLVSTIDLKDFNTDTVEKLESSARQLESGLEEIAPTRVRLPSRHGIMKMKAEEAVPVTPNPVPPRP